jgi:hypothetical protein
MLRVVKRAVLSQCWVHVNSSFYLRWRRIDAGADVWAICVEAREIRVHQRRESYPCHCVTRQILEQVFKLMFMSSDSIHDAVLCAEKRGRTPARSIDAALLARSYTRNCDYLIINSVSLRHYISVTEVCRCWQTLFVNRRSKSQGRCALMHRKRLMMRKIDGHRPPLQISQAMFRRYSENCRRHACRYSCW